jgi:hypothetical protein
MNSQAGTIFNLLAAAMARANSMMKVIISRWTQWHSVTGTSSQSQMMGQRRAPSQEMRAIMTASAN